MDMKAGVPLRNPLDPGARECVRTHHENIGLLAHLIHLAAEFPINQVSDPDWLVWYPVEYDVADTGVSVKSISF
jgi:hypothetical protein